MNETHWKPWVAQDDTLLPVSGPVAVLYGNGKVREFPFAQRMSGWYKEVPDSSQIVAYKQLEEVSPGSWGKRLNVLEALRDQPQPNPSDWFMSVSPEEAVAVASLWDSEQHRRGIV